MANRARRPPAVSNFRRHLYASAALAGAALPLLAEVVRAAPAIAGSVGRSAGLRFALDGAERARFLAWQPACALRDHQVSGAQFIVDRVLGASAPGHVRGGGLCDDMRMGKSRTMAFAMMQLLLRRVRETGERHGAPFLVLVRKDAIATMVAEVEALAGRGVLAVHVFETEQLGHAHYDAATLSVALEQLTERTDVIVASHSFLAASTHPMAEVLRARLHYRVVFCDEAHGEVAPDTRTNKTLCALSADSKWYVSGTPIQNSLHFLRNALLFMGARAEDVAGSDASLVALARQLIIRRSLVPVAATPLTLIDFATPVERQLYAHVSEQLVARIEARHGQRVTGTSDELRAIHVLRTVCISPYLVQDLFEDGTLRAPENVLLAPRAVAVGDPAWARARPRADDDEPDDAVASPVGAAPDADSASASYERLVLSLLLRTSTLAALGADAERAFDGLGFERQPLVDRTVRADMARLRPFVVPLIGPKERWVCERLLSGDLDRGGGGGGDEKAVIYANFRAPLRRLAQLLDMRRAYGLPGARGYAYVDGDMTVDERDAERARFRRDPECTVLLATTEVNNTNLDMTAATRVVIYDPWWNPNPERQAIARSLGLAQTRPVHVYRLVIAGTIDEYVAREADRKLELDQQVLPSTVLGEGGGGGGAAAAAMVVPDDPLDRPIDDGQSAANVMARLRCEAEREWADFMDISDEDAGEDWEPANLY